MERLDNNPETEPKIVSPERGIRYGNFESLEKQGIKHAFSYTPENMSFGAENDVVGRHCLCVRLSTLLRNNEMPIDNQVTMIPNILKPEGNFIFVTATSLAETPSLREIYNDPPAPEFSEYPKLIQDEFLADGMFTTTPGVVLEVMSRDCIPAIVIAETKEQRLTGVVHGGRRQIESSLAKRTIEACHNLIGAEAADINISLAPYIGDCHYTFDQRQLAESEDTGMMASLDLWQPFIKHYNHNQFSIDIGAFFKQDLIKYGVKAKNIKDGNLCTYDLQEQGLSNASLRYQKDQGLPAGRMITIVLHTPKDLS